MASNDGRCFVYVRYWPGFTEQFPYDRFNSLPDNEVEPAVRAALAAELWRNHSEIIARRFERKRTKIEAIQHRRAQSIARTTAGFKRPAPLPTKLRKTRCARFATLAGLVGWHTGGFLKRNSENLRLYREHLISPRIWIAELESEELAKDLVRELTELLPDDDAEWERNKLANPRYALVRAVDLSRGEQASASAKIKHLQSDEPMDWTPFVRPLLARVERYVASWQEAGQPRAPTNDDAHASPAKEVPNSAAEPSIVPPQVPAGRSADTPEVNRDNVLAKLKRCERTAYFSFLVAEAKNEGRMKDRPAYDWLKENGFGADYEKYCELTDYKLPAFDTWQRQLRVARKALGEQKHSWRANRSTGKSIVRASEI